MIRLAHPWWLMLLAASAVVLAVWLVRRTYQRYPVMEVRRGGFRERVAGVWAAVPGVLAAAALTALAVGLARPQEVLSRRVVRARGVDMVIVLDVSGSMAALDFQPTDRLGAAKEVIREFLSRRPSDRIGLVAFAGSAVTLFPLTLDHEVSRRLLDDLEIGVLPDGTAIGMGLGVAVNRLRQSEAESRIVILVTDGANNAGKIDPDTAAGLAADEDVTVHTVLVGHGGEVPIPVRVRHRITGRVTTQVQRRRIEINPQLLRRISDRTGGRSFRARDARALEDVFDTIDDMERTAHESTRLVRYRERFEPWALAAIGLLTVGLAAESVGGRWPW